MIDVPNAAAGSAAVAGTSTRYGARTCPSCTAAPSASQVAVASDPAAEAQPFEDLQQQWYGFFKKNSFFTYNRCSSCGMLYSPQYFTEPQLAQLYASMPPNMVEVSDGALERTQLGYFRELQRYSKLEGQFLEIGPDVGMFAEACVRFGHFTKFWMFEPNADAHAELRRRVGTADLYISTELLDLSDVPDGSIDAVAMIHVLDHILDPVGFLSELRPKLKREATLLIVTHDESSLLARVSRSRFPAYCLQRPSLQSAVDAHAAGKSRVRRGRDEALREPVPGDVLDQARGVRAGPRKDQLAEAAVAARAAAARQLHHDRSAVVAEHSAACRIRRTAATTRSSSSWRTSATSRASTGIWARARRAVRTYCASGRSTRR